MSSQETVLNLDNNLHLIALQEIAQLADQLLHHAQHQTLDRHQTLQISHQIRSRSIYLLLHFPVPSCDRSAYLALQRHSQVFLVQALLDSQRFQAHLHNHNKI